MVTDQKTATVTDVNESPYPEKDLKIVHADIDGGHVATLYYHPDEVPDVGAEVPVFFEMGGWNTTDSRVYEQRAGYTA